MEAPQGNETQLELSETIQVSDNESYETGTLFRQEMDRKKEEENTQAILSAPKKTYKKKMSLKKENLKEMKKNKSNEERKKLQEKVKKSPLMQWLSNYWIANHMMIVMNDLIKELKKQAMTRTNRELFLVVQALNHIMKAFVSDSGDRDLTSVSLEQFVQWALGDGLSTTSSNLLQMDVEKDLEEVFFCALSKVVTEFEKEEEELKEGSLSSVSIIPTSTLSTTAHTPTRRVDAEPSTSYGNSKRNVRKIQSEKSSLIEKSNSKLKRASLKKRPLESEVDSSSEDERPIIKKKKVACLDSEHSESEEESKDFNCLLDDIVQAHSSIAGTSKISQCISVQERDDCITLKSPGTSGKWVIKFDIYPYRACARNQKQDWWRHASLRSTMVVSGKDSRVGMIMEKMKSAIIEQMTQAEGLEIERRPAGSKRGWKGT